MLHRLPPEVALDIVSYLPLQSLCRVALVSRAWHDLIVAHESEIYRNAALLHRFVGADKLHARSMAGGPNAEPIKWKSFCARQLRIERGWRGKAPPMVKELATLGSVHRIKVDEKNGFVITTCQTGGLLVTSIKDNKMLWALSPSHVVGYARCEYARGYLIFNRHDNCKEVWRHSLDIHDDEQSESCPPDDQMRIAHAEASSKFKTSTGRRGHFRPWSLLQMPEVTWAFHFSYPMLLASATDNAYLYDVSKSRLVETIHNIQQLRNESPLGPINHVEVNDRYAFVCGSEQLRIYATEGGASVFDLATKQLSHQLWDIVPCDDCDTTLPTIPKPLKLQQASHSPRINAGEFLALHISPSGKDIAALTSIGVLVLVPGFERLFSREVALDDIAIQINLQLPIGRNLHILPYLAISEQSGKIAVVMTHGIYLISPDLQFSRLTAEQPSSPGISICRLHKFSGPQFFIPCIQATHSGIYFSCRQSEFSGLQQPNDFGPVDDGDDAPPGFEQDGFNSEDDAFQVNEENTGAMHMPINRFLPRDRVTVYSVTF